ncbi:Farnesyl diphosphate synthase [Aquimixticola soesokkakensis]|uniref:Geranylgeranyl diphosphate synthase n=1 Tax=Aquimixticola soesokkakensis TaxID=1519096 RepID=A0A1Y5R6B9_9RHOB|nr:farnesyl diphosphate synthase [Aquimixticola soesokkakensis]SLN10231.1 Farnesyl diphosphate synthase [Aquimixticola soesokkakensis]
MKAGLEQCAGLVQACFDAVLAPMGDLPVVAGMRYASRGGKRLRAFLVMESAALHGIDPVQSVWAATAVEALHAYSLVHDDLPCMDDDDLRRGMPTVHVKWDEATAVLVGDALQTMAFEVLARDECAPDPARRIALVASLARASGAQGMVLGQAQDIAAESAAAPLDLFQITELQNNKTGALIEWSAKAGPLLAGADPSAMGAYARALGLAFQIHDDVLDVTGDAALTGKAVGKDAEAGKATFVSLLGLEGAKSRAAALVEDACDALSPYGTRADALRDVARFVISRQT